MSSAASLHERLGGLLGNRFHADGHTYDGTKPSPLRHLAIATFIRVPQGPDLEEAYDHFNSLPADYQAQILKDWE